MLLLPHRKLRKKKELNAFYKKIIGKGDLCFDIGANRGERTDVFLNLGASVIAVEPQQDCIEILKAQFGTNKFFKMFEGAVSNFVGYEKLWICEMNECSSMSNEFIKFYKEHQRLNWTEEIEVSVITLDSLISSYGKPAFCKIDVEGYEKKVLEGLSFPIKNISFEFNHPFLKEAIECIHLLQELGNPLFNYIEFEKMEFVLEEWQNSSNFKHIISDLPKAILTGEVFVKFDF